MTEGKKIFNDIIEDGCPMNYWKLQENLNQN